MSEQTYEGACYCGAIKLTVTGKAAACGICHCRSCRKWHGTAINIWAIWPDDKVEITEGADQLTDVAVLRIRGTDLPVAAVGTSEGLLIGEWSLAIGNPSEEPTGATGKSFP